MFRTIKTVNIRRQLWFGGAISANGLCGLKIFDKGVKVNAAEYIQVLDRKIKVLMTHES